MGTLAVETGISAHAVAAALGHESVTTTLQSYAKAGAGTSARQQKVLRVLSGGAREGQRRLNAKRLPLKRFADAVRRKKLSNFVELNGIEPSAS